MRASEKRCHKNESIRRKPDGFCSLQIVDGILKILVEPPDVQPVDGFVVDLETDWEYEPAVLHLIIAPAYAGDAVIGLNPVTDSPEQVGKVLRRFQEIKEHWQIPTQICVLAHVTAQIKAVKAGAPCDLIFQSIAGSQKGNEAFGFSAATLEEARQLLLKQGTAEGPNVMYFETGQGSELSSNAHFDTDQVTMEARCYGFAKRFSPFLVNTVGGFIGPEYLYDARQVTRAGLEDHFMGKLTGISMGCDCCYTNHMKADQNDIENLASLLTMAGCNYFMGIPHGDDIMLNYQTTGFRETAALREITGKTAIPEFQRWLEKMGFVENGRLTKKAGDGSSLLF